MLNKTFVLASMLGSAIAFSATCKDTAFDPKTNVLSSHCLPRDNSAYLPTELDLNKCFGYSDGELTWEKRNYSDSCNNCRIFQAPDPWFRYNVYWLGCTCEGQSEETTVCIEIVLAHEYVSNDNGVLRC
ncbi:hypothetical protein FGRA07_05168 [Fusarium graminearum]|nr:hypothetical protein FGRA07_05168 [Fusarium graminearum]